MSHPHHMVDYAATYDAHNLAVPEYFNFGADIVDRFARDEKNIALVWCDKEGNEHTFSYADISRASNRVANYLTSKSIHKGDRVIVMLPRIPEWQICLIACLKVGAIPIPCITILSAKDVHYRIEHSGAVGAVTLSSEIDKFAECDHQFSARLAIGNADVSWDHFSIVDHFPETFNSCSMSRLDPAIMYYTSGSTGQPKGVCHPAQSLFTWRYSAHYWLALTEQDVMWCTADTGWSKAGTSILFGPWSKGSTVFFYDGPFETKRRFELIEKYKVTVFCAAATELRRLVREPVDAFDLSSLRLTVSAGESVNPEILDQWEKLTGVPLLDGYGQTETLMTVLNYPGMPVKPGSMGRAIPGVETSVLLHSNKLARPGQEGELLIGLPNTQTMLYYWNDPEKTNAAFCVRNAKTWFKTGDNVIQDNDGYYYYRGRTDDIISSSGYRIGPQEVENALIEHPAVQESAVVGIPDEERGEIVKAFVILNDPGLASPALITQLREHTKTTTAPYKYPRQIEFVEGLPKTISGKIQRNLLRNRNRADCT